MKTQLLSLMAVCAVLTGCGAPSTGGPFPATFGQDASNLPAYEVQTNDSLLSAVGQKLKPFFKQQQLLAILSDSDAAADLIEGAMPESPASSVSFDVRGVEQLVKDQTFSVKGNLTFRDTTRKLRFQGDVTSRNVYVSDQILFSYLEGALGTGERFSLEIGEISLYAVSFCFRVYAPDGTTRYQYTGNAEKGKLKTLRN